MRKARRAGESLDSDVDLVMESALDRLHETVAIKLGADSALEKLEQAAIAGDEVTERTRRRVSDALADAADGSADFTSVINDLLADLASTGVRPVVTASGDRAVAVAGNINMKAEGGSVTAVTAANIAVGRPLADPSQPGRAGG
jgi:hypothetical protein